jgi:hypothetical protein
MGAENFEEVVYGTDLQKLFEKSRDESRYEQGHSYSGAIGMKSTVVLRSEKLMGLKEAEAFAEEDVENSGKWDDDCFALKVADADGKHIGFLLYGCAAS